MAQHEEDMGKYMQGPIPGESLTQDPETPQPYETAPEYNTPEDFIDDLFMEVTQGEAMDGILDPIRQGIAIEDVAQMLLFQAMSSGKINTDVMLGSIEPTIYMLIGLAEYAGIEDPQLYPEDPMIEDDDDVISALEAAVGEGSKDLKNLPVPKGISKSLVDKMKEGDI